MTDDDQILSEITRLATGLSVPGRLRAVARIARPLGRSAALYVHDVPDGELRAYGEPIQCVREIAPGKVEIYFRAGHRVEALEVIGFGRGVEATLRPTGDAP